MFINKMNNLNYYVVIAKIFLSSLIFSSIQVLSYKPDLTRKLKIFFYFLLIKQLIDLIVKCLIALALTLWIYQIFSKM
ncbi:MAG: hypothetical protein UR43_C0020G0006 [candidate division TM6 bacterium GW2011_GWF2_33_332]|nr:MAG: hypothetical protein UR43_C0020G0006 [candidate division TM6 bacterium GW2011_GWF2_33_332]